MARYAVARLDEITEVDDGRVPFRAVRHHFGIKTFGITAMIARAVGEKVVNEHSEEEPNSGEELYLVMSGHAVFELDGDSHDAPAGTFVHVPAEVKRSAVAREPGTVVVAVGAGREGEPYEPSGWEMFAPLFPLFESGDYEQGADRAEALLNDGFAYGAGAYYNTACFESRAGRTDEAIRHLRQALKMAPSYVELAREDEDFDPLRDNPGFAELVRG